MLKHTKRQTISSITACWSDGWWLLSVMTLVMRFRTDFGRRLLLAATAAAAIPHPIKQTHFTAATSHFYAAVCPHTQRTVFRRTFCVFAVVRRAPWHSRKDIKDSTRYTYFKTSRSRRYKSYSLPAVIVPGR